MIRVSSSTVFIVALISSIAVPLLLLSSLYVLSGARENNSKYLAYNPYSKDIFEITPHKTSFIYDDVILNFASSKASEINSINHINIDSYMDNLRPAMLPQVFDQLFTRNGISIVPRVKKQAIYNTASVNKTNSKIIGFLDNETKREWIVELPVTQFIKSRSSRTKYLQRNIFMYIVSMKIGSKTGKLLISGLVDPK